MALHSELLAIEQQFWTGDTGVYRQRVVAGALMVLPQVGVLTKEQAAESVEAGGARWTEATLAEARVVELSEDAAVLTYAATARRAGDAAPYRALASSVYVRREGRWMMAFHQQTPAGA